MNTQRRARTAARCEAVRLARKAVAGAGPLDAVAEATRRNRYTVSRWRTERWQPEFRRAFEVGLTLNAHRDTSARAFAEAATEMVEFSEVVMGEPATLKARGFFLLEARHQWNLDETVAAETGAPDFEDKLEREGHGQIELAAISRVLRDVHDIDLRARYRGARS